MSKAPLPFTPGALQRIRAAQYVDVSPGHFDKLVREGLMPAPRDNGGVKVWLREELDAALYALPPKEPAGGSSCDVAFGIFG